MNQKFHNNPFFAQKDQQVAPLKVAFNYLLVIIAIVIVFALSLGAAGITLNFDFVEQYHQRIWDGFVLTVEISCASLVISMLIGIPVAIGRDARFLPIRYICDFYVTIIRGTPLIAQIYLFYYIIGTAWGIENRVVAGVIILSVFAGAYIAEIIRGGLLSLSQGQLDAAHALGMTQIQTALHVVFPQMVARTLPALTGQFASIIKDSSLLSVIAVIELTQTMREITATNYNFFGGFLLLGLLYLVLTLPVMFISRYFERRFDYEQ